MREVRLAAGAGFVTVLNGAIRLMPGLPARPSVEDIDLDPEGCIAGLRRAPSRSSRISRGRAAP